MLPVHYLKMYILIFRISVLLIGKPCEVSYEESHATTFSLELKLSSLQINGCLFSLHVVKFR